MTDVNSIQLAALTATGGITFNMGDIRAEIEREDAENARLPELATKVMEWAMARRIIPNAKPHVQLMKTGSELGELFDAEAKGDRAGIIDGIGDVLVTLVIYAKLHGLTLGACLASAYDEIKDRKGTLLPNGLFVKDVPA